MTRRQWTALAALVVMAALCAGCGGDTAVEMDLPSAAAQLLAADCFTDELTEPAEGIALRLYQVDEADVAECMLYCSSGATAEEIALFRASDAAAAGRIAEACEGRIARQTESFRSYVPEELPKLEDAVIRTEGCYVLCVVAADAAAAAAVLDGLS